MTGAKLPIHHQMERFHVWPLPSVRAATRSTPSDYGTRNFHDSGPALLYSEAAGPSRTTFADKVSSGPIATASTGTRRWPSSPTAHAGNRRGVLSASLFDDIRAASIRRSLPVFGSFQPSTQLSAASPSFHPKGVVPAASLSYADVAKKGGQQLQQSASFASSASSASSSKHAATTGNPGVPCRTLCALLTKKDMTRTRAELNNTASYCSMRKRADVAGWGASPFLPESPLEYIVQKRKAVSVQMQHSMKRIVMLEAEANAPKSTLKIDSEDGLSPVLAQKTCFNVVQSSSQGNPSEWPTQQELQMSCNSLPLPQAKQPQSEEQAEQNLCTQEDETRQWDWLPPVQASSVRAEHPEAIQEETLGPWIRDLLKDIDEDDVWRD